MNIEKKRAWRRFKDQVNSRKGMGSADINKPEKNWKFMYLRKKKLVRAKQLGFEYPRKTTRQLLDRKLPLNG